MEKIKNKFFTEKDMSDYKRDGFLVVSKMYSSAEIDVLSQAVDRMVTRGPIAGKEMFYYEDSLLEKGKRVLSRIEKFTDSDPEFQKIVQEERMAGRVSDLLGDKAILFKDKINFKLPGGGGFAPHQDIQPGWDDYAPFFISVLVTIDSSTIENGCLELASGHHTRGLLGEKWKPLTQEQLQGVNFKHYPMEPGDVAFFDCYVPHQSKPNLTKSQRRNLYLTYNRALDGDWRGKYFSDKRKSYPPDNEREAGKEYIFKV